MELNTLKQAAKRALSQDLLGAFDLLRKHLEKQVEVYESYLLILGRFHRLKKDQINGILSYEKYEQRVATISRDLMTLIDLLTEADMALHSNSYQRIQNPILVICRDQSDRQDMVDFFARLEVQAVEIRVIEAYEALPKYDLLIFANHSLGTMKEGRVSYSVEDHKRFALMERYLSEPHSYGIHYGGFWPNRNAFLEQAHAANSRFSLYGRIKEMIDYLNHYRVARDE